ncbi:MAG: hypothetical protein WD059_14885 [Balneolaceae bacterium]
MKYVAYSIIILFFISSCNSEERELFPVSGIIIHNQNEPTSLNENFNFNKNSFVLITISHQNAENSGEAIYKERFDSIDSFPFEFVLDPKEFTSNNGEYTVKAEVFAQERNALFVGDLVTENGYFFSRNTDFLELEVFGLEHCDADFADSLCTTRNEISANCAPVNGKIFKGHPVPPPCTGGEGCGNPGSVSFSQNNDSASFYPTNSDAIALLSFIQEDSKLHLFFEESNSDPIEFLMINDCKEIQHKRSGDVYRDSDYGWDVEINQ